MSQSLDVVMGRPPRTALIVGVVVDLELSIDAVDAADRIRDAAESLRAAGLGLILLPPSVRVKTQRQRRKRVAGG